MRGWIPMRFFLASALVLLLGIRHGHAQFPIEKPKGYVNDFAGVLRPAMRQQLEDLCKELDEKAKAQLAIVTVRSLEGRPLEEFTIDLATRWGIGGKGSDRGVMLFLAIQDRRSRIEVGYGLEPIIPDGKAGEILRSMTPYLRNGDYDGAVLLGASTIARIIAADAKVAIGMPVPSPPPATSTGSGFPPIGNVLFILVILFILFPYFLPRRMRRRLESSGFGGFGGGGSGGGGGGSFGGFGGGSFGGGGASGSW